MPEEDEEFAGEIETEIEMDTAQRINDIVLEELEDDLPDDAKFGLKKVEAPNKVTVLWWKEHDQSRETRRDN